MPEGVTILTQGTGMAGGIVVLVFMLCVSFVLLTCATGAWQDARFNWSLSYVVATALFVSLSAGAAVAGVTGFTDAKDDIYYKVSVDKRVNMVEFLETYQIEGQDGMILEVKLKEVN